MADFNLPKDLMLCILTRLPLKSICRFKCVCKRWYSLLSSADFVVSHHNVTASNPLNHSLVIYRRLFGSSWESAFLFFKDNSTIMEATKVSHHFFPHELVGLCNGLFGVFYRDNGIIVLWNPATSQQKTINFSNIVFSQRSSVGMGFDSSSNDFKVLSIMYPTTFNTSTTQEVLEVWGVRVHVYSANRDCWENVSLGFKFQVTSIINGAIVCGVPYWRGLVEDLGDVTEVYVRYDVKSGVFDHIPVPKLDVNPNTKTCLVEWKNCLNALTHSPEENVVVVMIFDECEREWITKFIIGPIGIPIATIIQYYCIGTKILLETPDRKLFLFDPETNMTKEVCTRYAHGLVIVGNAFDYIESSVHLKGMIAVAEIEGQIRLDMVPDFWRKRNFNLH